MPQALGLVETKGLVGAIVAADAMLKAANVTLIGKEKVTPALITIKIIGETAAVKSAIEAGAAAGTRVGQLISTHLIPHPDIQLSQFFPELSTDIKQVSTEVKTVHVEKENVISETPIVVKSESVEIRPKDKQPKKEVKPKKEKKVISIIEDLVEVSTKSAKADSTERKVASLFDEVAEPEIKRAKSILDRLKAEALSDLKTEDKNIEEEVELLVEEKTIDLQQQHQLSQSIEELESFNVHQLRKIARGVETFPIHGREISRANRETLLAYFRSVKK